MDSLSLKFSAGQPLKHSPWIRTKFLQRRLSSQPNRIFGQVCCEWCGPFVFSVSSSEWSHYERSWHPWARLFLEWPTLSSFRRRRANEFFWWMFSGEVPWGIATLPHIYKLYNHFFIFFSVKKGCISNRIVPHHFGKVFHGTMIIERLLHWSWNLFKLTFGELPAWHRRASMEHNGWAALSVISVRVCVCVWLYISVIRLISLPRSLVSSSVLSYFVLCKIRHPVPPPIAVSFQPEFSKQWLAADWLWVLRRHHCSGISIFSSEHLC